MSKPTKEYYLAKAELCSEVANRQASEGDIGLALANLLRAQNALQIVQIEEDGKWKRN